MKVVKGSSATVRVLISDMSPLLSSGISAAIGASRSFEAHRCSLRDAFDGGLGDFPAFDVVVIDNDHGVHLARERANAPIALKAARVFVINPNESERDLRAALLAGVHGYATLALTLDEFIDGIRAVAQGIRYICPRSAQHLADGLMREPITARESDVLEHLARGCCNKQISSNLDMALGTVKAHIKALMSKLEARTRTQVVTIAIAQGLVAPGLNVEPTRGLFSVSSSERRIRRFEASMAA